MSYSIDNIKDLINGNTPAGLYVVHMSRHDENVFVFTMNNDESLWFTAFDSAATIRQVLRNKGLID